MPPVTYSEEHHAYLVTRHSDVAAALRHPELSSAITPGILDGLDGETAAPFLSVLRRQMDLNDPPEHTRLRQVFGRLFSKSAIERLSRFVDAWIARRLDAQTGGFDLVREFAEPLPGEAVAELLGINPDVRGLVLRMVDTFVRGMASPQRDWEGAHAAVSRLRAVLLDDASAMPAGVPPDDLVANVILIVAAGQLTTTHLIGNAALMLLREPAASQPPADDRWWAAAIDEVLRYESPVRSVRRVCRSATVLGGQTLGAGSELLLMLGTANRDATAFPNPDRFDVSRAPNPHVAFGGGLHACLGAQLARLQAAAVVRALMGRGCRLEDQEIDWLPLPAYRGLRRLMIASR